MRRIKYQDFPRKAKKAIKRNFLKTIPCCSKKEVKIKELRMCLDDPNSDYKGWNVCSYELGKVK